MSTAMKSLSVLKPALLLALILAAFVLLAVTFEGEKVSSIRRNLENVHPDPRSVSHKRRPGYAEDGRPIMYTFYHQLDRQTTGMTKRGDRDLIDLWSETWEEMGWKPIILNLNDARRHEHYDEYYAKLQDVPIGQYDQYCYLRWLAVAAAGGGWMSDYDVLPIRNFDPEFGRFTVYDNMSGMGMPYLVSGTQKEWNKLAMALLRGGLDHKDETLWSDMFALMKDCRGLYNLGPKTVVSAQYLLTGEEWTDDRCKMANQYNAIHFCHDCLVKSILEPGATMNDRPKIAMKLIKDLREQCAGSFLNPDRPSATKT